MQSGFASLGLLLGKENVKTFGGRDLGSQRAGGGLAPPRRLSQFGARWVAGSCGHVTGVVHLCLAPWRLGTLVPSRRNTQVQSPNWETSQGRGGCSGWERRVLGVRVEDAPVGAEDVWGHHGGCSG